VEVHFDDGIVSAAVETLGKFVADILSRPLAAVGRDYNLGVKEVAGVDRAGHRV
jgi:hypothetical protein